jgi:hypothetical protein
MQIPVYLYVEVVKIIYYICTYLCSTIRKAVTVLRSPIM